MTLVPNAISYRASKLRVDAQATTSSSYKTFFRALQACSGNVSAMTKVARDFIGAGLLAGAVVKPEIFTATAEKTVSFFAKLESMKTEREFPGIPRRPREATQPLSSSGGHQYHQAVNNDPFLKLANEMFVAYTDSEPYWSGGMPMSVEGNNAQSYYGRDGVPPSMALPMEEYNAQPYRGDKGVQPSMALSMEEYNAQPYRGGKGVQPSMALSMEGYNAQPYRGGKGVQPSMALSMEEYNAQPYRGDKGVQPSMALSMEGYNAQPYRGDKGVQPSMAEAMFHQPGHVSNGYYSSPEEGWTASMRGSYAGGADARSFSYGGDYHNGLTPYTTPCNNSTANNGPMVCGFCLDSACRCYHPQQHAGNMHFQPPLLTSGHTMANPEISAPSTTAITVAGPASEYRPSVLTCPGQHGLTSWVTLAHGYPCHFCGGVMASGVPVLSCSLCQVYACPSCVWMHHNTAS